MLSRSLVRILNLPFNLHITVAFLIRIIFVCYANYHDQHYDVPYTDIDYRVFTDAAKHVYKGDSPYKRHTYRYSPIIAFLLTPNVFLNVNFGKILFCVFDLLCSYAIKKLIERQLVGKSNGPTIATYCSLFWLYNPMSIAISTRGNADSVPCFIIILSLFFLQTNIVEGYTKYVLSGILLGFSIHLRLYPIAFTFPMYLSLGEYKINRNTGMRDAIIQLLPNKKQLLLALCCISSFIALTGAMYILYGYEFLFETYIYHLFRKDIRHNFSVLFYYTYLTGSQLSIDLVKFLTQICECVILFVISLAFGTDKQTLPFALFCQSIVLVAYNSVMTSQYFIWFLSLLPLVVHDLKMKINTAIYLAILWVLPQAKWLFYAYLLEFKSRETFFYIWASGIFFFVENIYVLGKLVKSYSPSYGFGQISDSEIKNK
ncbi:GPI mannosyltransferase 1 [Zerene cesonia]|uniref:GPI mannosyltransferase 1 n=1 Tax=Zerene cesonia TaxID=33412 RepID=UPI0018E56405|nr:GPI mannosyltransferase 1 [Zerene cesonia]